MNKIFYWKQLQCSFHHSNFLLFSIYNWTLSKIFFASLDLIQTICWKFCFYLLSTPDQWLHTTCNNMNNFSAHIFSVAMLLPQSRLFWNCYYFPLFGIYVFRWKRVEWVNGEHPLTRKKRLLLVSFSQNQIYTSDMQ